MISFDTFSYENPRPKGMPHDEYNMMIKRQYREYILENLNMILNMQDNQREFQLGVLLFLETL